MAALGPTTGTTGVTYTPWISQETHNKVYNCYLYICNTFVAISSAVFERFKERINRNSKLIETKMAEINAAEGDTQRDLFVDALGGQSYSLLQKELTSFFQKLKQPTQHEYLATCCQKALETENPDLISRAMYLLSDKKMLTLASDIEKESGLTLETCLKHYQLFFEVNNEYFAYQRTRAFLKTELGYIVPFLLHRFAGIFELLYKSTQFLEPGQGNKSAWDSNFSLELLGRFISIPTVMLFTINAYFPNPILASLAFTLALTALAIAIYSYIKWFKPVPNSLPYTVNMTHELKIGKFSHVCGRDLEIGETTEQFFDNIISTNRQHPLFIGESGVGKTSTIYALVEELAKPDSHLPEELKGLSVFYVNATEISKEESFAPKSRLKEIRAAIGTHGHKVVLIIDEIQELMKSKEKGYLLSLLDTSNENLPFFVGITSKEEFEKNEAFKEKAFERRFKKIVLNSTEKDPTIHILKETLKSEAPEISVEGQEIYDAIYKLPHNETKLEPAKSIAYLSQFQGLIRRNLAGRHLIQELKRLDLELKQAKSNMVGSVPPLETAKVVWDLESQIEGVKKQITQHKKIVNEYKVSKEKIREKEFFLNELAKQIDTAKTTPGKTNRVALQFLFERYYLLPAMKKALVEFAKKHALQVAITEELVKKSTGKQENKLSDSQ